MIVHSADGRIIGIIDGTTFFKNVNTKKHKLRQPPGWGTDADSFDRDVLPHCQTIRLTDETGKIYETTVKTFSAHSVTIDRGFGRQYVLPDKWWTVPDRHQGTLF